MSPYRLTIPLGWRHAVAALFVMALQVSMGERANASCGDWLAHDSMPAEQQEQSADAEGPRDVPSPCSSGQCRQAPDHPLPGSPHRSLTPQPDQWGALGDFDLGLKSDHDRFALEVPLRFPEGLRLPLERPPRS
jgi:hypothetical protein